MPAAPAVGSFKTCSRRSRGSICGKKTLPSKPACCGRDFSPQTNAEVRINNNQTTTENATGFNERFNVFNIYYIHDIFDVFYHPPQEESI